MSKKLVQTKKGIRTYNIKPKNLKKRYQKVGKLRGKNIYLKMYFRNLASRTYDFRKKAKDSPNGLDFKVWHTNNRPTNVLPKLQKKLEELDAEWMGKLRYNWKVGGIKKRIFNRVKHGTDIFATDGIEKNRFITETENDSFRKISWTVSFIGPRGEDEYKILEEGNE